MSLLDELSKGIETSFKLIPLPRKDYPGGSRDVPNGLAMYGGASGATSNKIYVGCGNNAHLSTMYRDWYEYDPVNDAWTRKADYPGTPNHNIRGFGTPSTIYVGLGFGLECIEFFKYDPTNNAWERKADFPGAGSGSPFGATINETVYAGFGVDPDVKDWWAYDSINNLWERKLDFPGAGRGDGIAVAFDGKIYAGLGASGWNENPIFYNDWYMYDPDLNTWIPRADFIGEALSELIGFGTTKGIYVGTGVIGKNISVSKKIYFYNPVSDVWREVAEYCGQPIRQAIGVGINNMGFVGIGNHIKSITSSEWFLQVYEENLEIQDREEGEGDSRGQLWQLRVVRDVLGNKLRSTRFDYTYYSPQPDGTQPRDTITITEAGADDQVISVKKLKHYPDGKQPVQLPKVE